MPYAGLEIAWRENTGDVLLDASPASCTAHDPAGQRATIRHPLHVREAPGGT